MGNIDILSLPSYLWTRTVEREEATEESGEETANTTTTTSATVNNNSSSSGYNQDPPVLLPLNILLCSGPAGGVCTDYLPLEAGSPPAPSADCRRNLVRSLHLDIVHSGLAGIQAVDAYLELVDMGRIH